MVFPGEASRAVELMTAPPASISTNSRHPHRATALRAKPRPRLPHPPPFKPWDNQGLLPRAGVVVDAAAAVAVAGPRAPATSPSSPPAPSTSSLPAPSPEWSPAGARDYGFERIRAKLLDHLREAAGRIELPAAVPAQTKRKEPAAHDEGPPPAAAAEAAVEELPWKLRARRSGTSAGAASHPQDHRTSPPSPRPAPPSPSPKRTTRSAQPERRESSARRRRARFSVPLTKEEIDEDLYAFTGRRAPRRPKKRPRPQQKRLDMLFPGLWLTEVTLDTYHVADPPPPPPPPPPP